jgi:hypothetical protein
MPFTLHKDDTMTTTTQLPQNLIDAIQMVYHPASIRVTEEPECEVESTDYSACRLALNGQAVAFRVAKTTPTKLGQFVTMWKRPTLNAAIAPFDIRDGIDFVVVSVFDATHRGQFVFNKETLAQRGVMSREDKGGKRAMRVYPPWVTPASRTASATQKWQLECFFSIAPDGTADSARVRELFGLHD